MPTFVDWVMDTLTSRDVIDLYFILSDLVDIELSDAELCESAYFDTMASETVGEFQGNRKTPLGKLVL